MFYFSKENIKSSKIKIILFIIDLGFSLEFRVYIAIYIKALGVRA